ncbi:MAG: lipase family protein [Leptolyngbya sp. SIO3F4]|nr:lipase family protein [Leptolyngbya sp. SIO3F4]
MTDGNRKEIQCGTVVDPFQPTFDKLRAQELICLGREARMLYREGVALRRERDQKDTTIEERLSNQIPFNKDTLSDKNEKLPAPFENNRYRIIAPLVFTQIVLRFIGQRLVFGFIAEPMDPERKDKELFIVYRGSQTPWDWISNFRIFQTKRPLFGASGVPGEVHSGFNAQFTRADEKRGKPSILQILKDTLTPELVNGRSIYISGHSLGGALATLTAAYVKQLHSEADVHLYSNASPRVGDVKFAQHFTKRQIKAFRLFNSVDLVPTLPPRFESPFEAAQYVHIGVDIPFESNTNKLEFNHTLPIYAGAVGLSYNDFNYLKGKDLPFECK